MNADANHYIVERLRVLLIRSQQLKRQADEAWTPQEIAYYLQQKALNDERLAGVEEAIAVLTQSG